MRWRAYINLFEMSQGEAIEVFRRFGVNVAGMDSAQIKQEHRKLIRKHHPDAGGKIVDAQQINAAFDVLKDGVSSRAQSYQSQPRRAEPQQTPAWAWAGYSGGMPPGANIYRNDYSDVNFIKKRMWELSNHSQEQWTIQGYDGAFFRGMVTVFGDPSIFKDMAEAMIQWQTKGANPHPCRAVFVDRAKSDDKTLYCIYSDGRFFNNDPPSIEHDSFNRNASNDQSFMRRLPQWLDQIGAGRSEEISEAGVGAGNRAWTRTGQVPLDFDLLYGKAFKITDPEGNPERNGFSIVTPMNGSAWTQWAERPQFKDMVRQNLNKPDWLMDHKYNQIVISARKLGLIK